jgi:hypothetical protein
MATVRIFPPPQFNGLATFQQETVLKSTENFFLPIIASLLRLEKRGDSIRNYSRQGRTWKEYITCSCRFLVSDELNTVP